MPYFLIETAHLGNKKIRIGGTAIDIRENRIDGNSTSSQIAVAKIDQDGKPIIMLQTHDQDLPALDAALKQALETVIYDLSKMPLNGIQAGLGIWGITLISYVED